MTYVANQITTTDAYTTQSTLICAGAVRVNLDVSGGGIFYQLADDPAAARWRDDIALNPGFYSLDQRADAVRVRSMTPGTPATVTLAAYPPNEVTGG